MALALSGVLGYYARATPMSWSVCEEIEAVRAEVLASRQLHPGVPRAGIYLDAKAGGAGHTHVYQYAAAAFVHQVDCALASPEGCPARVAMAERVAT